MKHYELSRFGNAHVLTHTSGKRIVLKTFEDLTRHIYRFHLVDDVAGLDSLPLYHQKQIGYKAEPRPIKDVATEILQSSGFTNPSLIS